MGNVRMFEDCALLLTLAEPLVITSTFNVDVGLVCVCAFPLRIKRTFQNPRF